jgi:PadR family transcriptional regulator, regulatory protein PadR
MAKPSDLVQGTLDLLILKAISLKLKHGWAETETVRQAKSYSLTAAGRAQLETEATNWSCLSTAINLVVETT